jgi:CHAT domain-containing protein
MIGSMSEIYLAHFRLAWNYMHDGAKAFQIIENARGRALLARLGSIDKFDSQIKRTPAEIEITALQSRLLHSRLSPTETRRLLVQLDRAYDNAFPLLADQNRQRSIQTTAVSLDYLRQQLGRGGTLVEYVLDAKTSYAMEITNAGLKIHSLPGRSEIDELTKKFLSAIKNNGDVSAPGKALYKRLISEALNQLPTSLIVVPDGSLHSIPFGALVDNNGRYLSQSMAVSSAPSAGVYLKLRTVPIPREATKPFLGVAYSPETTEPQRAAASTRGLFDLRGVDLSPLPFAREEVSKAAAILGTGTVVLDGVGASERALKAQPLKDFKVIHLAAHAVGNEVEPDRAALVLAAGGDNEDGLGQAREISRTRLNADVIVLSVCETGVGRLQGEEGVMNLARAFLTSGAKSVLASLWSVEDRSTATIMESFYEHLAAGLSVSEALRQAQLDFIKDYGPKAQPNLWAGNTETGCDIRWRHAAVDQRLECIVLVRGVHCFALHVFGKADFRRICFVGYDRAGDGMVRLNRASLRERLQRMAPPAPGDDGVFAALILPDDERLQETVRRDGCGHLGDVLVGIGLADIAVPGEELVQGDCGRDRHDCLFGLSDPHGGGERGHACPAIERSCHRILG